MGLNENKEEREANLFALSLLMPESFIKTSLKKWSERGVVGESLIPKMAKEYQVTEAAMRTRLCNLGYLTNL